MNQAMPPPPPPTTEERYYDAFRNRTIVVSADRMLGDDRKRSVQVLRSLQTLLQHEMRVVLVYGESRQLHNELVRKKRATRHEETNKLVVTEESLTKLETQQQQIESQLLQIAKNLHLRVASMVPSVVTLERRVGHRGTGAIRAIATKPFQQAFDDGQLALVGFLGKAGEAEALYVPAETLAAELAVQLEADKLMLLEKNGCLLAPSRSGGKRVSFLDLEQLLCLLQRTNNRGEHVVKGQMVSTLHNAIRAVAGGVEQVHLVSDRHIIAELTTRTGAGTLIERHHTHTVERATLKDMDDIVWLHDEAVQAETAQGTPLVVPRSQEELLKLLPHTLVLKHRNVVIGKLHAPPIEKGSSTVLIGGYCIGENHQNWQHGKLLLEEALERLFLAGKQRAVAITASDHAAKSFARFGNEAGLDNHELQTYLAKCKERYGQSEQANVRMFEMDLKEQYGGTARKRSLGVDTRRRV